MNQQRSNPVIRLVSFLGMICISGVGAQEETADERVGPVQMLPEASGPVFDEKVVVKSHSEQFRISGSDSATRGTVANLAERIKTQLLALTGEEDEWSVPINIRLVGKPGGAVGLRSTAMELAYSETGYEVGIFVSLSRGLEKPEFQRAVISALIYGRALRGKGGIHLEVPLSVPPWCVEGLLEAMSWQLKQADRKLYHALFMHGGVYKLDDLFAVSEADFMRIDAASKAAFRVSSGALVMALLEQPNGKAGMRKILAELPAFEGEVPVLLRRHFPELNLSQRSLEKWWSLQLANKGSAPLTEVIGVIETEERLSQALQLRYRDSEGKPHEVPITDWELFTEKQPAIRNQAVSMAQRELVSLSYRCFPSYRPLLREYQELLKRWVSGETRELSESLANLALQRRTMVEKAQRARDFLDWFEITRALETSGEFEDYLKLKAQLKSRPNRRTNPISEYLDRIDPLFTPKDR